MKNKHLLFALPLLFGVLLFSCQDEATEAAENNVDKVVYNATIEKAKAIFESKSPDFPIIQSRTADGVEKGIVFEPVWDDSFVTNHTDGTITVETHVRLSQPFRMLPQDSKEAYEQTKDGRYLRHLSRVVVMISEDESISYAFLMTIVGSRKYMETHDFQLWNVSYGKIPDDFSGMLFYHSLDGEFVNGWYVEEGHKYSTCEPISKEDANLLSRSGSGCYTEQITTYYVDCQNYAGYNYSTYEDEIYLYTWAYAECGDPYPVVEYYTVCDGANVSGGGYTPPVGNISKFVSSYPSGLQEKLANFVTFINNKDCASQAVSQIIDSLGSAYVPVKVELDPTLDIANAVYNATTNTIFFKSVEDFSDMSMLEEIIHSVQRVLYTSVERDEGQFNLEFEAKLIIDYIRLSKSGRGDTDMSFHMKHEKATLSDNSEKLLGEWLQDLHGEPFEFNDYRKFLQVWRNIAVLYWDGDLAPMQRPKLIYQVVDLVNQYGNNCLN